MTDNPPFANLLGMSVLIISLFTSLLVTLFIVRSAGRHAGRSADHDLSGPQKFHSRPVPRIGGLGVFAAVVMGAAISHATGRGDPMLLWGVIACSLPAFLSGLAEDLTKNVSPRRRLAFTALSAGLAVYWLDGALTRSDIPGVDHLLTYPWFAAGLTIFLVTGVANAVNIIDGFNGLATMCVVMMMLALAYVGIQVGDTFAVTATLIIAGSVLGFFVFNFPAGLIFLGDGGAYLLGFLLGELSVLLVVRNPDVSPLCPLLLCAYPIFETTFSIYRKKFLRGMSPGVPDGIHLHMLVYKRLLRWTGSSLERRQTQRNSMTSPYLWFMCMLSVVPAVLFWKNTLVLAGFIVLFIVSYVLLYWSIVRFRAPRWLVLRK